MKLRVYGKRTKTPKGLTIGFAREWLSCFGEDVSIIKDDWCWEELEKHYSHRKQDWFDYVLKIGDPYWIYYAARYLGLNKELAYKKLLEIGDSFWIYNAERYLGLDKELAYKKLLKIGDSFWIKKLKIIKG